MSIEILKQLEALPDEHYVLGPNAALFLGVSYSHFVNNIGGKKLDCEIILNKRMYRMAYLRKYRQENPKKRI